VGKSQQVDPFRADAALVFRFLRDAGPSDAVAIAEAVFPTSTEGPPSSIRAIRKSGLRRVYDSIVWMRHQGVTFTVVPLPDGLSQFHLGVLSPGVVAPLRVTPVVPLVARPVGAPVTAKVSQAAEPLSDAMDIWHGGS